MIYCIGTLGRYWTTERLVLLFVICDIKCDIYMQQLVAEWQKETI